MKSRTQISRRRGSNLNFGFWILDLGAAILQRFALHRITGSECDARAVPRVAARESKIQNPKSKTVPLLATLVVWAAGCSPNSPSESTVVVYTSIDQPFAEAILADFTAITGIKVNVAFDTEAGKTTGFLRRLVRERENPRCDVWWSSECFGTIELARAGVFDAYDSPLAGDIPAEWKDAQHLWTGIAARARVLAFDPSRTDVATLPKSWVDLCDARWAAQTALANPQFGTTRGHFAALYASAGPEKFTALMQSLRDSKTRIADGNSHSVRLVTSKQVDLGWTDTDDVLVARGKGASIDMVYPTLTPDGEPMWIPCTVALVKGAPSLARAKKLVDFLVSTSAERALAVSDSKNVPVRAELRRELEMDDPPLPVPPPFERIADALEPAMKTAREMLLQ